MTMPIAKTPAGMLAMSGISLFHITLIHITFSQRERERPGRQGIEERKFVELELASPRPPPMRTPSRNNADSNNLQKLDPYFSGETLREIP
ncbi:hypothetical protein Mal48_16720 [Thalassoglobus polymorphus]|uniref:Uncharacterized protein n=1 Tax=Thalassoglobus polymorphus TaxID=2527994 RepID=A0A517QLC1_9PLAN|nr:hypothetical protein Mal48_16720 [Thalassoglobus polymorphus]